KVLTPMKFAPALRLGPSLALAACLCLAALAAAPASAAFGPDWKPIDPSHLAMKAPVVEKDADAEVIFWEVRVADEMNGSVPRTVLTHYVRIKIFTERGRESQSRVDILAPKIFGREIKINDIAGRTIKPDGSIVELKKEDIYERDVVKASGVKVKAKTFAMPAVEPGAIIEYRWREVRGDTISFYDQLDFSRDIPVQFVKYSLKPLSLPGFPYGMRAQTFHGQMTPFVKEKDGYYSTSMSNVPAFREEPRMPPEHAVRPWMLVYYSEDKKLTPDKYWKEYGKEVYEQHKTYLKVNDEIKRAAAEAVAGATTDEEKLQRLFDYVRAKVKNAYDDAAGYTSDQLKKLKNNKTPADTLKRGVGDWHDIDMLFGALAAASGFDVRVAKVANRQHFFFDPNFPDSYFIESPQGLENIAVRVGDQWRFYDPGSAYTAPGMLNWQEEGQPALISDPKDPIFVTPPVSGPEKSVERRTAKLKLSEDGTLEGDLRIEYTGHLATDRKEYNDDESPASREELLKNMFKSRHGGIEITDVKVENVTDPVKPFVYTLRVKVPAYAARTGKRLLFQPAFFQRGLGALFPTSTRRHTVYFHYPWSEEDKVEIELPAGFALDNAEAPTPLAAGGLTKYQPRLLITKDGRTLTYERKFHFGAATPDGGNSLMFPTSVYSQLKTFFDELHKQDGHTLSIKQAAAAAPTASN
ncbi:MAG TPA: DUF3857 domain-containing protein, partial [Pyrinomonadaceae bacterium]